MNKINKIKNIIFLIFIILMISIVVYFKLYDLNNVKQIIVSKGRLAPIIFFILCVLRPILLLPIGLFSVLGGIMFGAIEGTILTVIASVIGSVIAYYIALVLGADFFTNYLGKSISKYNLENKNAFKVTFLMRVIPILPCDFVSYVCGLSKINLFKYILGTFLGIIPGTYIYSYFGSSLNNVYSKQFVFSIIMLVILTVIPIIVKKKSHDIEMLNCEIKTKENIDIDSTK